MKPIYYVLHRRAYRESSQIIDLFCEKQGRFSALHRINKKQSALQPFTPYQMQFSGRGELKYCQHVEIHYPDEFTTGTQSINGTSLKGKVLKGKNLYCGFYINELIMRLTWQGESQTDLFRIYQQTLLGLLQLDNDLQSEPILRRFEFHLLAISGYQYNWQQDCHCHEIQAQRYYQFDPSVGFIPMMANEYSINEARPNSLYQGVSGEAILAIAADDWQHEQSWRVAKQIARLALQPLLGNKPLKSRELFKKI